MAHEEGCGILIAARDLGHVRQFEGAPLGDDRRLADLGDFVESAVEAHLDLRPLALDRSGRGQQILVVERGEYLAWRNAQGRKALLREVDEDALWSLADEIGRASCRGRVGRDVEISGVAVSL